MTGQWEKYVEQAAKAIDPPAFDETAPNHAGHVRQFRRDRATSKARAMLAAVGPLIEQDTRERMVAAAARAVERGPVSCGSTHPDASHIPCVRRAGHSGDHISRAGRNWPTAGKS